jgi:hypothetical protein
VVLSRLKNIALGLGLVVLAGCNFNYDSPSGVQAAAGQTSSVVSKGTAELVWQMPTENTNGTPLTDLAGYTIIYGSSPATMNEQVQLTDISMTDYVVQGLGQGTWYFAILSNTSSGVNSVLSNIASKTIS